MLGGLQSTVDTLFPSLKGVLPSPEELAEAEARERSGRIVKLSGYHTKVFDMHSSSDAAKYDKLMLDLSDRAQRGDVRILVHDRQVMHRKDGSSGWFGYVEWMEYDRLDNNTTSKKGEKNGKVS